MSLIDDVIRYYAARAPVYDATAGFTNPEAEALRAPIKQRYKQIFRGRRVLEIARGSGYWTKVIGEAAESVLATDINPSLLSIAAARCKDLPNVRFQVADAYTLDGVPGGHDAALGIWWWSHIPSRSLKTFLSVLHGRLVPGSVVLFNDQLPYAGFIRKKDNEGNTLEQRVLPDGRSFDIVKNFPGEPEVKAALEEIADDIQYTERPEEQSWEVTYRTKQPQK